MEGTSAVNVHLCKQLFFKQRCLEQAGVWVQPTHSPTAGLWHIGSNLTWADHGCLSLASCLAPTTSLPFSSVLIVSVLWANRLTGSIAFCSCTRGQVLAEKKGRKDGQTQVGFMAALLLQACERTQKPEQAGWKKQNCQWHLSAWTAVSRWPQQIHSPQPGCSKHLLYGLACPWNHGLPPPSKLIHTVAAVRGRWHSNGRFCCLLCSQWQSLY